MRSHQILEVPLPHILQVAKAIAGSKLLRSDLDELTVGHTLLIVFLIVFERFLAGFSGAGRRDLPHHFNLNPQMQSLYKRILIT